MSQYTEQQIAALNVAADTFISRHKDIDFYSERLVKATIRQMLAFERVDQALSAMFSEGQRGKIVRTWEHLNEEWNRMRALALETVE